MADGSIVFKTTLDNSQLEKDLKDADKEISDLKKKIEKSTDEKNAIEEQMDDAKASIKETEAAIDALKAKLEEISAASERGDIHPFVAQAQIAEYGKAIEEAKAKLDDQKGSLSDLEKKWNAVDADVRRQNAALDAATQKQKALGVEYANTYRTGSAAASSGMASMSARFDSLAKKITKGLKNLFIFSLILKAVASLKDSISDAISENDRFAASIDNLRAVVNGFAAPAVAALAGVLTGIVNAIASMIVTLARLVDGIFQTNIVQSIQQAQLAARSSGEAANAADEQAKATRRLSKAQKDAAKWLAAFDELNVMQAENSEDISDAMNDLAEGGVASPDWDALDVGKIDDVLAEIMIVLGGALMAVGAILAFSGINIPLGLTLMAVGALMIYTAASENWGKLPQETRDAITTAIALTGMVMLVLGTIIAFASPAHVMIGVGMMAAGAMLLFTTAALNWNEMPENVRSVVSVIMGIVGFAFLVLGFILISSPANIPLSVALIALGAATLAGDTALNWNAVPDEIKALVSVIMGIVGIAFLVLGFILVASPAHMPLAIALIALGAVSLAADAALNWEWLSGHIEEVVALIFAVVSVAFLVIGIILAASNPAAAPLGIAMIAVGALALGENAELNWDKLPEDIQAAITVITTIVGAAFLAIGAILAFTMVALPLGIALMAIGAVALVKSVTDLDWDAVPNDVKDALTTIAGIVGGFLLPLGIILCLTGVGIPLGLALIIAGAGSLAAAIAPNADDILNTIRGVWDSITSWFAQNVAPIFTIDFWANLFGSIGQGLFDALTGAASAFHSFIVGICKNIGGALSMLGEAWSYSIPYIYIPALAEGAVIPPNREFLAVLGDQKKGRNIEAPEDLIRQIVRDEAGKELASSLSSVLMQFMPMMQGQRGDGDAVMVLTVDGEELARAVNRGNASLIRRGAAKPSLDFR